MQSLYCHAGPARCINNQNVTYTYNVISATQSCYVQNTNTAVRYGSYFTTAVPANTNPLPATSCCGCASSTAVAPAVTQAGCFAQRGYCVIPPGGLTAAGGLCQLTPPQDPTLLIGYNTGANVPNGGTTHVTVCGCTN